MKRLPPMILCILAVLEMVLVSPLVAAECTLHMLAHRRTNAICCHRSQPLAKPAGCGCSRDECGPTAPVSPAGHHDDDHPQVPCSGCKPGCPACETASTILLPDTPNPELVIALPHRAGCRQPGLSDLQIDIFHPPRA